MNDAKKVKNSKKFSKQENNFEAQFQRDLDAACRPLKFISETDADLIPFAAGKPPETSLEGYMVALGIDSTDIEERSFDTFFDRLTTEKDWHGAIEKGRTKNWRKLRRVLEKKLEHRRVIRVGKIRLDIYVAGVDASGRLSGVKTKAIET